jgi:hypothetical protein
VPPSALRKVSPVWPYGRGALVHVRVNDSMILKFVRNFRQAGKDDVRQREESKLV